MNQAVQNNPVKIVQDNFEVYMVLKITISGTFKLQISSTPKQITVYCKLGR